MAKIDVINAPAGTGKTTTIGSKLNSIETEKKVLCLTYTNVAVDELEKVVNNTKVDMYTIHSFLSKLCKYMFHEKEAKNLYLKVFKEKINHHLCDDGKTKKYKEKKNCDDDIILDDVSITQNIRKISYSERNYSSYLYGYLSHNDLITYMYEIEKKFHIISKFINLTYDTIILDEYQDTSEIFMKTLELVRGKSRNLTLEFYGDDMQRIFNLCDNLAMFETNFKSLTTNFRSSQPIINLLNNLYPSDTTLSKGSTIKSNVMPVFRIVSSLDELKSSADEYLNLFSTKKKLFEVLLGPENIFDCFFKIKTINGHTIYGYNSEIKIDDVFSRDGYEIDPLLSVVFKFIEIYSNIDKPSILSNKYIKQEFQNNSTIVEYKKSVLNLSNKIRLIDSKKPVGESIEIIKSLLSGDCVSKLENSEIDYTSAYQHSLKDYKILHGKIFTNNEINMYSTQHGIKGQSCLKVNFICWDNVANPCIDYEFLFEILIVSKNLYSELEDCNKILKLTNDFEELLDENPSKFKKVCFENNEEHIQKLNDDILNLSLEGWVKEHCENLNLLKNTTNFKEGYAKLKRLRCFILTFKLFYVGCSRAQTNLNVLVNSKLAKDKEKLRDKMKKLGFDVVYDYEKC